jgi:hypothetical protein
LYILIINLSESANEYINFGLYKKDVYQIGKLNSFVLKQLNADLKTIPLNKRNNYFEIKLFKFLGAV